MKRRPSLPDRARDRQQIALRRAPHIIESSRLRFLPRHLGRVEYCPADTARPPNNTASSSRDVLDARPSGVRHNPVLYPIIDDRRATDPALQRVFQTFAADLATDVVDAHIDDPIAQEVDVTIVFPVAGREFKIGAARDATTDRVANILDTDVDDPIA